MGKVISTEHPHIVKAPGVAGGRPTIRGSRIAVDCIARFYRRGVSPDEIMVMYPHLPPAAVYDAISYYIDHMEELAPFVEEVTPEQDAERHGFTIGPQGKVIFPRL